MRKLAVFSGKGGTGKTTLTASFARLAGSVVAVDADVDAANLGLLLSGEDVSIAPFEAGRRAVVDPRRCTGCGRCSEVCRFDAVRIRDDGSIAVDELACEGCGACALLCPADALRFRPNRAGEWRVRRLDVDGHDAWLVHGALGIAQDNSGKLVAQVRKEAEQLAARMGISTVLLDGPPGIGCPVHAALGHQDRILAVTEPTPSGIHDLLRLLDTAVHFNVPAAVAINKADLAPAVADAIERTCADRNVSVLGRIPFDEAVPQVVASLEVPLYAPAARATSDAIRDIWQRFRGDGPG